ncbi:hypothetical protein CJ255_15590 [Candidatus Viridilinea mediisalina]|uniref:RNA polymerase sigma-70 region 2 domain-containing protein n=2 Tax=Candidatus Viridilinea mediisalina TaxID=2024553 RepID=A0A2A6RG77_9CHLR|nr:hypothetical protein CJ255_15590 [Candidatus Viridilinea mediisalina]
MELRPFQQYDLEAVAEGCRNEQAHYDSEGAWCYELFLRGLALGNSFAATAVQQQFGRLVIFWIKRHVRELDASIEDELAHQTWAQFWRYCSGQRFERFHSVAALLAFLRKCAISIGLSYQRKQQREAVVQAKFAAMQRVHAELQPPDQLALKRLMHAEQLQQVQKWLEQHADSKEYQIFKLSFYEGLRPAEIVAHYHEQFPDIEEVRALKERLLKRLRRDLGYLREHEED